MVVASGHDRSSCQVGIMCIQLAIEHRKANDKLTKATDLILKMFVSKSDPKMKLSGAETWSAMLSGHE